MPDITTVDVEQAGTPGPGGVVYDPNAYQNPVPAGYAPFETAVTDPTTGIRRRLAGRAPIAPPEGVSGGIGLPPQAMAAAFSTLPVDQALKAVAAAEQYQAQRGYQADLAAGKSAPDAFAKWAPMLFGRSTGNAALMSRLAGPTAQQQAATALMQARTRALTNPAPKVATPHEQFEEEHTRREEERQARIDKANAAKTAAVESNKINEKLADSAVTELRGIQTKLSQGGLSEEEQAGLQTRAGQLAKQLRGYQEQVNPSAPAAAPGVNPAKPQTATNPKTGQKVQLIDGVWQPIPTQ